MVQWPSMPDFHSGDTGSNPVGSTKFMKEKPSGIEAQQAERPPFKRKEVGSSPTGPTKDLTAENVEPLLMELLKYRQP
jgi:hypothetical protein